MARVEKDRIDRAGRATLLRLAMEVDDVIGRVETALPDPPAALHHFLDLHRKNCSPPGPAEGGVTVGVLCNLVPEELVRAAGAVPVRLCSGSQSFEQVGGDHLPARCCPLVKATLGRLRILQETRSRKLDLIVVPTTCDQRRKACGMLREEGCNVYPLEVPPVKESEEAVHYWQNSVKKLALHLEKVAGRRITRKRLGEAIAAANEARRQYRRLFAHMRRHPSVVFGTHAMMAAGTRFFEDPARWAEAAAVLNDELEKRVSAGFSVCNARAPRILFTGSPPIFPNLKLPLLVEASGAVIVADELCSSSRLLYDPVSYAEDSLYDMIPALADRYLKPCTCPFHVGNGDRVRRLLELAGAFRADGVVYQSFSGCSLYEMEQRSVAVALQERGVPMLYVETDYGPEDAGQLSTRVDAFLESVKNRKRKG